MPPQLSSDEGSSDAEMSAPKKGKGKAKPETEVKDEDLQVESGDEEDEDEDLGEDEFVVEKILSHMVDEETGGLLFEVKWEGYEKKTDRTWEPEDNLIESAHIILNNYLQSIGGREAILEAYEDKAEVASKKKRGRASTGTPQGNGAKKSKKNGHPASTTPPASLEKADFKPPSGNWEDEVVGIDACEGGEGKVVVYLTWKNGQKSQHPLQQVYKRCPQKMLKFYESHLVFKQSSSTEE